MAEWISIEKWHECAQMEHPGMVFELRNREGHTLRTRCTAIVPAAPFDWKSGPIEFRLVAGELPQH